VPVNVPGLPLRPRTAGGRGWMRWRPHPILLPCLATVGFHLSMLAGPLSSDEGGYAVVARYWTDRGPFLYGPTWVDRPPGLIAAFALADRLGRYGVRLTALAAAVLLVAAVGLAAGAVGGRSAAHWAGWLGFAFSSSVLLEADRLDGELLAATCVAVSMALLLGTLRRSTGRLGSAACAFGAGCASVAAVLMKQDFVDGLAFGSVLLLLAAINAGNRRSFGPGRLGVTAVGFAAGVVVTLVVASIWARDHRGVDALLFALYGFRAAAAAVMAHGPSAAPLRRLGTLAEVAVETGVAVLLLHLAFRHGRTLRTASPLAWAFAAAAVVEVGGVLAGENYWRHYLIALVPTVAIAGGLSARRLLPGWRATRVLALAAVLVTVVVSPVTPLGAATAAGPSQTIGRWVAESAQPGDTITVAYSHANIVDASGLRPAYPYAWSLPIRTLDPHLSRLTGVLEGHRAPTWFVRWNALAAWGLDSRHQVQAALGDAYHPVGSICGHRVWLHDGLHRSLATVPTPQSCRGGAE
jgi:hypothetical protein